MNGVPFPEVPKVALLDWDGTFCDSRKSIYDINLVMAEHYAKTMPIKPLPSYEEWLQASHPGVEACMRALGVTDSRENINKFFHRLLVEQNEAGLQNPLYEGTQEFLMLLEDSCIPAVVISRHLDQHLKRDIDAHGLGKYFHKIIGEPADRELQKDKVMRDICIELSLIRRRHVFYLGDTSHDMRLAKQAGVCGVAVSHGYDPVSELEKEDPAHIFGSLAEFQEFLSSRLQ